MSDDAGDGYDEAGNPVAPPLASVAIAWRRARCRACHEPIIWTVTFANNAKLAVNTRPTLDGTVEVLHSAFGDDPVVRVHGTPPPAGHTRYRVHRASCTPRARGWRGRQQKERP